MGKNLRNEKWQRTLFLVAMLSVIAIFVGIATACFPAPTVNAAGISYVAPTITPQPPGPTPTPPTPTPKPTPAPAKFSNVRISKTSIPKGRNAEVSGAVINCRTPVTIRATLKKYYNSYTPYTVATYRCGTNPDAGGKVALQFTPIFNIHGGQMNLATMPTGHYYLVIEATVNGQTISTPLDFYIV